MAQLGCELEVERPAPLFLLRFRPITKPRTSSASLRIPRSTHPPKEVTTTTMQALKRASSSKELAIGMIPGDGIGRIVLPVRPNFFFECRHPIKFALTASH